MGIIRVYYGILECDMAAITPKTIKNFNFWMTFDVPIEQGDHF